MSRPNSTSSSGEGLSADSGIGSSPSSRSPLSGPEVARSASYRHQEQNSETHLRRIQSEYRATQCLQTETINRGVPHSSIHFAGQVALSSWPATTPSLDLNGRLANTSDSSVLTRPQTPYPFQCKTDADEAPDAGDTEKVLATSRKMQPLSNAPILQLDFTKPLITVSSQSMLDGREGTDEGKETEAVQCSISEAEGNIVRANTPIPSLAPPNKNGQHHKANGMPPPRTHQVYTFQRPSLPSPREQSSSPTSQIPSLLRVLDANLHPQPHLLSPLAEHDEQSDYTRSHSQLSDVGCAAASTQSLASSPPSPNPPAHVKDTDRNEGDDGSERSVCSCLDQSHRSRPRTNTQRTRETDPYPFNTAERPDPKTPPLPPAQCIERIDLRCGEVTVPHRCRGVNNHGYELAKGRDGTSKKKSSGVRVRVRMAWMKIKELFCRRGKI